MEYIKQPEQKVHKLSISEKETIASKIVNDFQNYDTARSEQLTKTQLVMNEVYLKNVSKANKGYNKEWKSTAKICKLYMYQQILQAFIWKNIYSNYNSMFDVSGESYESDNDSNKQKTMLVDCLEKMQYNKTCDRVIRDSLLYGELISFVTWRKETEEYRRPITFFEGIKNFHNIPKLIAAKLKGEKFFIDERVLYDNAYIYPVDPANFVFDVTQMDRNWETCPKINRSWWTYSDIVDNQYFEVTEECRNFIKSLAQEGDNAVDSNNQRPEDNKDEHSNGSTIEVLEHWGDLMLPDGEILQNWYAVVVAGKFLVRFEKNPFIMNPFTYGSYIQDPDNKRGISLLYSLYDLANIQEDMLRRTMDLQALNENPPMLAGKGFFGDDPDDIELHPGKILEYDQGLYPNIPVKPIQFDATVFKDDLSYLDDLMCEISGIFPNMAGATEDSTRTATEISTKVEGQLTRLKMLLDVINQNFVLADVRKLARIKANFTFGDEKIFINNENAPEDVVITDRIRQADYRYAYSDRSATSERFNYADMVAQSIQMFAKAGTPINTEEVFTWYMGQKGVENPERFITNLNVLSPEVQQALLQNPQLAPVIQEMQRRVELAKEGKELPTEGTETPQIEQSELPVQEEEQDLTDTLNNLPGRNLLSQQ